MKTTHQLRRAQLLGALNVKAHELRAWLSLQPLASRKTTEGSPNVYSTLDFLFLVVVQQLDQAGFKLDMLRTISQDLHNRLGQPAGENDTFTIHLKRGKWRLGPATDADTPELKVPLAAARRQVLEYTDAPTISGQRELTLLSPVRTGQRGRRA